ncbi:hypothetical protein D3C84_569570 [compost metagenome]
MLIDVAFDLVRRKLQLLEQRRTHIGIRQHIQQVLGIELATVELMGFLTRALQDFQRLGTECIGCIDRFSRHLRREPEVITRLILCSAHAVEKAGHTPAQQRVEWIQHALMA